MWWRLKAGDWKQNKGAGNRAAMKRIVDSGREPGILAYDESRAIGWCAVEPRDHYPRLAKSRTLQPLDHRPVWSVTCFFIRKEYRRRGVSTALLEAAAAHVKSKGGNLLEGYPVVPEQPVPDAFAWTGLLPAFEAAGFLICGSPSKSKRIVRREL
jgi:GNAT superfamily N-acetyltransferase